MLLILLTVICIATERRYTLAFIERWQNEHLHPHPPQNSTQTRKSISDIIIVSADSNCVLTADA